MWYIYILRCADGSFYTGITQSSSQRFEDHLAGKGSRHTRRRLPALPVGLFEASDKLAAAAEEARVKKLSRRNKLKLLQRPENLLGRAHP